MKLSFKLGLQWKNIQYKSQNNVVIVTIMVDPVYFKTQQMLPKLWTQIAYGKPNLTETCTLDCHHRQSVYTMEKSKKF